ncbi:hypothetical protein EGW08_021579, partial [Elysia chlorotica]
SGEAASGQADSIVDIVWCYAEQLSRPGHLFPCCAILTRDKVVLERLAAPMSTDDAQCTSVPDLKLCTVVPIGNIQQLVLGPCHAFLRLEEAFVGKPGTYTLFGVEPHGLKRFITKMFEVCKSLDVSNTPDFVDLSVQSDLLKEIVAWEEKNLSLASDRLAVAILVKECGARGFSFLVLSENQVYCLDTAFVHWPPASFEASPDRSIDFNILHTFSITNKISNIQPHPVPSLDKSSSSSIPSEVPSSKDKDTHFLQYQLDLQVSLDQDGASTSSSSVIQSRSLATASTKAESNQQAQGKSSISYLFFSAAHRDLFLDRLTNLRVEQAHRMLPHVREEPEGGNELKPQATACGLSTLSSDGQNVMQKESDPSDNDDKTKFSAAVGVGTMPEEDALSTGSGQTGVSEDNTIYYSASPSENLSVSPMSNFSRASISPPTSHQQASVRQNAMSHIVRVEVTQASTSQLHQAEVHPPGLSAGKSEVPDSTSIPHLTANSVINKAPGAANFSSHSIPLNLSDGLQADFDIAYEHLKRPVPGDTVTLEEESELDQNLRRCLRSYNLITPLPAKLKPLYVMGGREIRQFFKTSVADLSDVAVMGDAGDSTQFGAGGGQGNMTVGSKKDEELRHVLWTSVVPYTNPKHEIVSLVMVSTKGIYLVSDTSPAPSKKSRPSWMTHTRNQSDSVFAWKSSSKSSVPNNDTQMFSPPRMQADFATNRGDSIAAGNNYSYSNKAVKPFFRFRYEDLQQINVGVFDQCVRLTGSCADTVFTLAVRDSAATEQLIQYLKDMLTLFYSSATDRGGSAEPSESDPHLLSSWEADDFYREDSHRTKSTVEGIVYTHPSQVRFVYPGEDAIKDILFLVDQSSRRPGKSGRGIPSAAAPSPSTSVNQRSPSDSSLWLFLLCHELMGPPQGDETPASQPRSVIVTPSHLCLSQEDLVTYPLPDFVRGLPENPCHQITQCRPIEALKRVRMYRCNPHWLALTFVDEAEDFVVDTSIEHFGPAATSKERQGVSPEVTVHLFVQSPQEKDKLVQLLGKIWKQLVTQVGRILDVAYV